MVYHYLTRKRKHEKTDGVTETERTREWQEKINRKGTQWEVEVAQNMVRNEMVVCLS